MSIWQAPKAIARRLQSRTSLVAGEILTCLFPGNRGGNLVKTGLPSFFAGILFIRGARVSMRYQ